MPLLSHGERVTGKSVGTVIEDAASGVGALIAAIASTTDVSLHRAAMMTIHDGSGGVSKQVPADRPRREELGRAAPAG